MKTALSTLSILVSLATSVAAFAQMNVDPAKVQIKTTKVGGSVSMLEGSGGNIGVSAGDDGVFIIDDEFAPLAPKIKAAVAAISKKPLRLVFNTHWHGDHTGGNEAMAGPGVWIVAHDNVRKRMSVEQTIEAFGGRKVPPSPPKALPVVTFSEETTFYLNGDEIHVIHVKNAHTDGDAIIYFRKANVVHMGDTFINGMYPVIDYSTGGTIDGYIAAQEKVLAMIDDQTKLIPGHGPLGDKKTLQATHDMIVKARAKIAAATLGGKKTLEQVVAQKPTAEWDAQYGQSFMKPEMFVQMVYRSMPLDVHSKPLSK
jgi:glyoxylase-like metal-dependent hydrolase (beta-lactamase superfamily II)